MKVLVAGDYAPTNRLATQINDRRFGEIFDEDIIRIIKSSDFSFVNFEAPIVDGNPKPIPKYGRNLKCKKEAAEAIRYAGFTGVTLANNHILDYGADGLEVTLNECCGIGLDVVGAGHNINDASKVLYLNKGEETIAIINCCEHEFSIASEVSSGANPLNPIKQYYEILEARQNADYVLMIIHGGHEFFQFPSLRMQDTYRYFIDLGVDAIVNHHQHCYSGYEIYKGKPIFYGLGNFAFDYISRCEEVWSEGFLVELEFSGGDVTYSLYPYVQYNEMPKITLMKDIEQFKISIDAFNTIISDRKLLSSRVKEYYDRCRVMENYVLQPYSGRIMSKLYSLGLLPQLLRGNKRLGILNHIMCESHRDKLLHALTFFK